MSSRSLQPEPRPDGARSRGRRGPAGRLSALSATGALVALSGCATLGQIAALKNVDFGFSGISEVRLAAVDLTNVRTFSDLTFSDGARLANAVRSRDLPLDLEIQVRATNPADNLDARMVRMDWTLFLDGRETVSGLLDQEIRMPRGEDTVFPVVASLNLVDFFEGSAGDLFDLVRSVAGLGGEPKELMLTVLPTIQTALGPITYETPIRVVRTDVGR